MRCHRGSWIGGCALLFISWNAILVLFLRVKVPEKDATSEDEEALLHVMRVAEMLEAELEAQNKILSHIRSMRPRAKKKAGLTAPDWVVPVLVMACDRVTVRRCLDKLLSYRPSAERFPIVVSHDCGHAATAEVIRSYGNNVTYMAQPDLGDVVAPPEHKKFQGYYKIARHYKWALKQVFAKYKAVIIVEDDLEVAPDFFEYFSATLPLLRSDPNLWCVSAWNDNGRDGVVDPAASALLYRTDFFPGLGWMLLRELWEELEPRWPASFWDDWMRRPEQRRGRQCLRPEISRTLTFGRKGVSLGQFYDKYLRFIKLNSEFVHFTQLDLTYLKPDVYDQTFTERVYAAPIVTMEELQRGALEGDGPFRLQYSSKESFRLFAKNLGVMDDFKSGVPRTGYKGVVALFYRGRRVYLVPPPGWTAYDPTWN
ncbi:alpha-1,3-mannosyl-glycoprotein 2-beta-N-acetylglucosaminyltransferase a [Stigmatopora nigra]